MISGIDIVILQIRNRGDFTSCYSEAVCYSLKPLLSVRIIISFIVGVQN